MIGFSLSFDRWHFEAWHFPKYVTAVEKGGGAQMTWGPRGMR